MCVAAPHMKSTRKTDVTGISMDFLDAPPRLHEVGGYDGPELIWKESELVWNIPYGNIPLTVKLNSIHWNCMQCVSRLELANKVQLVKDAVVQVGCRSSTWNVNTQRHNHNLRPDFSIGPSEGSERKEV